MSADNKPAIGIAAHSATVEVSYTPEQELAAMEDLVNALAEWRKRHKNSRAMAACISIIPDADGKTKSVVGSTCTDKGALHILQSYINNLNQVYGYDIYVVIGHRDSDDIVLATQEKPIVNKKVIEAYQCTYMTYIAEVQGNG